MRAALTLLALVALSYLSPVWAQSGVAMAAATLRGKFGLETMNGSYQFQQRQDTTQTLVTSDATPTKNRRR